MTCAHELRYPAPEMTPLGRYVLETLVTLFAVAGLAIAILYAARRTGAGRPTGPLELAGRLNLDARRAIYLVRVSETVYVVGASEAGLAKLGELPSSALGDPALTPLQPSSPFFSEILQRAMTRKTSPPGPDSKDSKLGS